MKVYLPTIFFLIIFATSNIAQKYNEIDKFAKSIKSPKDNSVSTLSRELTANFKKEEDKVRAIFYWITENIAYNPSYKSSGSSEKTLESRKGVCADYSRLFKALCDSSNIKCYYIRGYARTYENQIGKLAYFNHAWNAVEINNKKYLLDVTWAAGTLNAGIFNKKRDERYYLCPPEIFIFDHFPEKEEWQLLAQAIKEEKFINFPMIENGFVSLGITDLKPINGYVIDNEINISFKTNQDIGTIKLAKWAVNTYGTVNMNEVKYKKEGNTYTIQDKIRPNTAYNLNFWIDDLPFVTYKIVSPDYEFELPDKLDLKNHENVIKYCLKNKDLNKLNRTVYSKKKYRSFNEIPNADKLIKRLSDWNGDYLGSVTGKLLFSYPKTTKYLNYKIDSEYTLNLKQENENWYFHSIILEDIKQ